LDDWEYQEVLVKGVRPLGDFAPLETSRMLIKAVSEMIRLRQRSEDEQEPSAKDSSEIWCDRVDRSDRAHLDSKAALVHTLTYACERVYEHQDDVSLGNLDTALRQARYRVFDRIRYHLYSRHPLRTITWIREAILNYDDYVDSAFGYEFQQMIRLACEQVGRELLSEADRKTIFDQILSGPDKQGFKEWLGDNFTEELYRQRQRYFWLAQLTPFATVLFDKYRALYNELSSERPPPTDADYSPFSVGETKTGGSRSPKRAEDLLELSDDGLIAFLNDWQDAHRDEKQWWVDVDFDGLGRAFGEAIQSQPARFLAWKDRWFEIERPIYFRYALDVATKRIKGGQHAELKEWLSVCEWVMAQNDASVDPVDDISETSRQRRAWDSARRAVVDLVEACISEEVSVSAEWQPQIYELLRLACTVQDQRLDKNGAIVTPRDYLTDAINTTRGRALENLVSYGWWLRRQERPAPEVFDVLESRFSGKPALSIPEYTLLATSFGRLWGLNADWMQHHVDDFFPKSKQETWKAAFGAFLNFIQPYKPWFELLEPHFELGLDNLQQPHETKARPTFSDSLGWHLFLHYLWGQFDGRPNLLELFYARTRPAEWALLFDQIGRSLKSTNSLSNELSARVKEFFEKRLSVANDEELREFTFWLGAECLDPEWRLRALSRVLDITGGRGLSASILIEDLQKIAGTQPGLVMECFRKLTNAASTEEHFYLLPEPAKAILNIGFASKDPKTIEDAEKAQDNLLSSGHLEYLELG